MQYEAGRLDRMRTRKPRFAMYELQRMSIPQLLAVYRGRKPTGITEKSELIQRMIDEERIQIIAAPDPVEYDLATLKAMRISELKRVMEDAGVFFLAKDVVEKSDLLTIFENSGRLNLLPSPEEPEPTPNFEPEQPHYNFSRPNYYFSEEEDDDGDDNDEEAEITTPPPSGILVETVEEEMDGEEKAKNSNRVGDADFVVQEMFPNYRPDDDIPQTIPNDEYDEYDDYDNYDDYVQPVEEPQQQFDQPAVDEYGDSYFPSADLQTHDLYQVQEPDNGQEETGDVQQSEKNEGPDEIHVEKGYVEASDQSQSFGNIQEADQILEPNPAQESGVDQQETDKVQESDVVQEPEQTQPETDKVQELEQMQDMDWEEVAGPVDMEDTKENDEPAHVPESDKLEETDTVPELSEEKEWEDATPQVEGEDCDVVLMETDADIGVDVDADEKVVENDDNEDIDESNVDENIDENIDESNVDDEGPVDGVGGRSDTGGSLVSAATTSEEAKEDAEASAEATSGAQNEANPPGEEEAVGTPDTPEDNAEERPAETNNADDVPSAQTAPVYRHPSALEQYPISQLQSIARDAGIDVSSCFERSEMVELLSSAGVTDVSPSGVYRSSFDGWGVSQLRALSPEVDIDLSHCSDREDMIDLILCEAMVRPHLQSYLKALSPLAKLSLSELRAVSRQWKVNINDCLEKEEILQRLISRGLMFGIC